MRINDKKTTSSYLRYMRISSCERCVFDRFFNAFDCIVHASGGGGFPLPPQCVPLFVPLIATVCHTSYGVVIAEKLARVLQVE